MLGSAALGFRGILRMSLKKLSKTELGCQILENYDAKLSYEFESVYFI